MTVTPSAARAGVSEGAWAWVTRTRDAPWSLSAAIQNELREAQLAQRGAQVGHARNKYQLGRVLQGPAEQTGSSLVVLSKLKRVVQGLQMS